MQTQINLLSRACCLTLLTLGFSANVHAQSTYLAVGNAKTKKAVLALTETTPTGAVSAYLGQIQKTIEADLNFIEAFRLLPSSAFPQSSLSSVAELKQTEWMKSGADFLTFSQLKLERGTTLTYELHVVNISGNKEALAKRYTSDISDLKPLSHAIANDIVFAITGKKGIFLTKIAFACDKTGKKEIYTMNFDGSDLKQITRFQSITMAPAWNSDGTRLAFSVYNKHSDNTKNIDLFEYNFKNAKLQLMSNKKGINSGANYHPNGREMAITLSFAGNPDLYLLDLETKKASPLTHSIGFDVDPSFSPDGKKLAFVSSRAGKPMVYIAPTANPNEAKRLTFAGQYNATPTWSPDGKKLRSQDGMTATLTSLR